MSELDGNDRGTEVTPPADERIPVMQRILDNPFALLFLGVAVPAILYLVWGIIEVAQIPIAN